MATITTAVRALASNWSPMEEKNGSKKAVCQSGYFTLDAFVQFGGDGTLGEK